jgi:hypothetical protein
VQPHLFAHFEHHDYDFHADRELSDHRNGDRRWNYENDNFHPGSDLGGDAAAFEQYDCP